MTKKSLQTLILELQTFWASHGCLLAQPYYTQVGAGTMNPATFLRVLGPEPWHVAYVEPSVRPDDGRYGENPNRFQQHTQFQVILKPETGAPQELYLESLKAIGIDPREHDIRFVEDNWAQPAISAWGLGWEVWLDGQEITQFTYFQQVGGISLDPVAVELTYGLERILIALNNADEIWDEPWNETVTYGEIRRQEEYEHSKYYFEIADVERLRQMYETFEAEAQACLDAGLVLPAHDYVLKCSHTFNILDTRGAVGVTERQAFFRKMRALARRVAESYLKQREELGYPLLSSRPTSQPANLPTSKPSNLPTSKPSNLLLEIGTEELPPSDVDAALAQLREKIPAFLKELRLSHGAIRVEGTPRRLTLFVEDLAPVQEDLETLVKGPPAARAFDESGAPTKAALGFARGKGVDVNDLQIREIDGGEYVTAVLREKGRPAPLALAEALPELLASLRFKKSMRWLPGENVAFSRPIRWILALLGETVIPFSYAGVESDRLTRGLRPLDSPSIEIDSADSYFDALNEAGILLEVAARREEIRRQVEALAESAGGVAAIDPALLDEVTHLVEKPTAFLGAFDEEFLALPREALIGVMKKHQRYFPVLDESGALLPAFIGVRNGDEAHLDLVRQGNEHVLRARFADANFFLREDLKQPLEAFRPKLANLIFQTELGSMLDKSERILRLAPTIGEMLSLSAEEQRALRRAAFLAKADLATQMVVEMTSLQGVMGREYALRSGEPPEAARAIGEQYLPVPKTKIGVALALADRLDSLTGLFAAGLAPTGNKDPFAMRRAALGVVQPLIEHALDFDLRSAVAAAAALQPIPAEDAAQTQTLNFLAGRLSVLLKESFRYDVVDAVLAAQSANPAGAARTAAQLQRWVTREDWNDIFPAYARCVRILRAAKRTVESLPAVEDARLVEPSERALFEAVREAFASSPATLDEALRRIESLAPAINRFFDETLVMAEDESLRENRLALVGKIAAAMTPFADLSKLEGF